MGRLSDAACDADSRMEAIAWNDDGTFKEVVGRYLTIGCSFLVGSVTARSYSKQDFWLTTIVTEILEERIDYYTSAIEASRSMARIEELLVEIGATNINKQYAEKVCTGIAFLLFDKQLLKTIPFHLKAQVEECFLIFWKMLSASCRIHPGNLTAPGK